MIDALKENPLLLLFLTIALGYWAGKVQVRGLKMGVAAVLFTGLAFGSLDPAMQVPDIVILLGLSIFVYTIGLSSGPGFFATFQRRGFRDVYFMIGMLCVYALIASGLAWLFGFDAAITSGLVAGSYTNTPSLAGLLDLINNTRPEGVREALSNEAVVGYSLSYPMGVLGVMLAIQVLERLMKVDYRKEEEALQAWYPVRERLVRRSVEVTRPEVEGMTLRALFHRFNKRLVFGRMVRGGEQFLPHMDTRLQVGDQLVLVGSKRVVDEATKLIGRPLEVELSTDRSIYDVRRFFVSNPEIAGQTLAALNLPERFSALITRVQRGDIDLLASGETVLELGDRVLVVARRDDLPRLARFFGNSYEALSQINLLSFGSGMALGLLLGMVTFSLPGGLQFNLGYAGGPLIVALLLGALRRTGPIVWTLPFSANLTLRQIGLSLLLAGIGIRSGHTFLLTMTGGGGWLLFVCGAIIATVAAVCTLVVGYKLLRIPFTLLTGMVANQPAILDFAVERAGNKLPTIGFTTMLPITMIVKILLVQVLFVLLS